MTASTRRWFSLNLLLLILIIGSFLTRLVFANFAASQSYEFARYSDTLKRLRATNEQLSIATTELQSVDRVKAESVRLNLVKVDRVFYVEPTSGVAINR